MQKAKKFKILWKATYLQNCEFFEHKKSRKYHLQYFANQENNYSVSLKKTIKC